MKKLLPLIFFIYGISTLKAQTMSAGDIAFVGYNTAGSDGFSFIALKNLPGGETLFFTDMGWAGNGWMNTLSEPHLKYVLPAAGIPKGTIISIIESSTANSMVLTGISGGTLTYAVVHDFNLSGGDQILAYQSTGNVAMPAEPKFIAGVHGDYNSTKYDVNTKWNPIPSSSVQWATSDSALPTGLTNGVNCISLFPGVAEVECAKYTGTLTGTAEELLAKINNTANWTKQAGNMAILPTNYASPSINSAPTASSVTNTGTLQVGQTLTGNYTYTDADSDTESGSTFKWYRSDNAYGLNKTAISLATAKTYVLTTADMGKYISFEVTPRDGALNGNAVESSLRGPVVDPVLPVGFMGFTVKTTSKGIQLNWQVSSELNNSKFVVCRSGDDKVFVSIGEVLSLGNTTINRSYSYDDKEPLQGNNYYKLLQIDNDGKTTELGVRTLNFGLPTSDIRLYPNPTNDKVNLQFEAGRYNSLIVVDVQGKTLKSINLKKHENEIVLDLSDFPMGAYFIKLIGKGESISKKVIRQH